MIQKIVKTTNHNPDFISLEAIFDANLWARYPDKEQDYWANNVVALNPNAILIYHDEKAVACGCFKEYNATTVELKRIFVLPEARGMGLAQQLIKTLEDWAILQSYQKVVLETLYKQHEAIALYQKMGYEITANYPPYENLEESVCLQKMLQSIN
jgi:GNAT superfamily N-acetyltransferase